MQKIIYVLYILVNIFLVFEMYSHFYSTKQIEGFNTNTTLGLKEDEKYSLRNKTDDIYDDFYVSLIDDLYYQEMISSKQIDMVLNNHAVKLEDYERDEKNNVLVLNSKTGNIVKLLKNKGIETHGLEKSKSCIKYTKQKCEDCKVEVGDINKIMTFKENTFTHALSYDMSVYEYSNKNQYFNAVYHWLRPGGYLSLHLVNKDKFNVVIPAASFLIYGSEQKHSKDRVTKSKVVFKTFDYEKEFKLLNNNKAQLIEKFKTHDGTRFRKNVHNLYMETQKEILSKAKDVGFIMIGKYDLMELNLHDEYLYVLQKPN